jgi:quercetin dioxygenase-like cupin family protein
MQKGDCMHVFHKDRECQELENGVRRILSYDKNLMIAELRFEAGAAGAMHAHPHEQIGYVIEGSLVFHEEGREDVTLGVGDSYYVAPNVLHGIDCLTPVKLLDVFTPMREDFIR